MSVWFFFFVDLRCVTSRFESLSTACPVMAMNMSESSAAECATSGRLSSLRSPSLLVLGLLDMYSCLLPISVCCRLLTLDQGLFWIPGSPALSRPDIGRGSVTCILVSMTGIVSELTSACPLPAPYPRPPRRRLGHEAGGPGPCGVCVYFCSTYYKAVCVGGGANNGGHVLRGTTSRGLRGLTSLPITH
jgi:hypothetical protein